ncbi:glycosyltransferase involved in cell wall biosynthesis [Saccharothrix ecbatanensis]|uniref:Glycosyltransferase involved in cell wall biosynthesis n=1 Tax=Saccharothrix ecbatanensis TaxID=1105145 RepID=A0A7W9HRZ0_9PSEU|nr:glycosyltransferase family 4 protein [Saccharothrix ecbatanensis]MBB5806948.1 glycosyltransferase involved in cell wall biosynthesis [Saccharothrix ecbatanensis]
MRIAIAFDCLFPWTKGGGERLYRQFAEEFVAAGHEVTYLTRLQWDEEPVIEGIKIVAVSQDRNLYDANGVRTIGPALRYAYGLAKHLRANRRNYDAVLVSAVPSTNVLAVRAALIGSKVAVDVDWLEVWRPDQWRAYSGPVIGRVAGLLQWVAAKLSPIASCHSQLHARRLEAGGLRGRAIVSHGLIDPREDVEPNPTVTSPPRVVYVGRHIADKRVETLPAAIAEARKSIPDLEATIFGEGTSRAAVLAEIDRLGLRDVVRTPGFVSQQELDEGIRTAAVLVNPSQREGYGLVVVESCAVGTPVVLVEGDDNAAVELVEPGVNGQVAKSTAGIGAAIVDVVKQGEALRKSTHDWYARVSKTNTVRASARQILERLVQASALR